MLAVLLFSVKDNTKKDVICYNLASYFFKGLFLLSSNLNQVVDVVTLNITIFTLNIQTFYHIFS